MSGGFLVQQIVTFITGIVVARAIGAANYGTVSVTRNILTFLLTVSPLGLDLALLKHATNYDDRPLEFAKQISRLRLLVALLNAIIVASVLLGIGQWLGNDVYRFPNFSRYLFITLIGLPFAADLALLGAVYRSSNRPATFSLMTSYVQPILRLLGSLILLRLGWSTEGVVVASTVAYVVSSLIVTGYTHVALLRRKTKQIAEPISESVALPWNSTHVILSDSLWMAVSLFIGGAMRSVDMLTLGAFVAGKQVGAYGALSTVAQLVQAYPLAASQTLGPTVARHFRDGDLVAMKRAMNDYLRTSSIIGGFVFGGIAAMGNHLDLIFGTSFLFRGDIAFLLTLGWLLSATLGPMGYSLSMTGRHRFELGILCSGFAALTLMCLVLVPRWGQIGAATAVVAAFALINVVRFSYVARIYGFVPGKFVDMLPPIAAYALALTAVRLTDAILGRTLIAFLFACVLYSAVYCTFLYVAFLTSSERTRLIAGLDNFTRSLRLLRNRK